MFLKPTSDAEAFGFRTHVKNGWLELEPKYKYLLLKGPDEASREMTRTAQGGFGLCSELTPGRIIILADASGGAAVLEPQ